MKLSADQTEPEKGGPKETGPGRVVGEGIPMYVIVNLFSNMLGRGVINNTGFTGKYDVNLQPAPDSLQLPNDTAEPLTQADLANLAIVEAVEKQLGLKLESIKPRGSSGNRPHRASISQLIGIFTLHRPASNSPAPQDPPVS